MLSFNDGSKFTKVLLIEFDQFRGVAANTIRELGDKFAQPGECADKRVCFLQAAIYFPALSGLKRNQL